MNPEPFKKLEERLKGVRPAPLPGELEHRIEKALAHAQRKERLDAWRNRALWGLFATAALLMLGLGIALFNGNIVSPPPPDIALDSPTATTDESDGFVPVLEENNLLHRIDEGIVSLNNGMTARRYRYEFIDRVVWKNPESGAVVEMEVPRDEVVLVPVRTF